MRKILSGMLAGVVLLSWAAGAWAEERRGGDREARRGRQPLTPEETAKRMERMKKGLEQRIARMAETAESLKARREELTALAAKATLPADPPSPYLFGPQMARGGRALAMRMASRRRGGPGAAEGRARPENPARLEVANTDDLKKALAGAADAYAALLPLLEEQKKATQQQLDQLAPDAKPEPGAGRARGREAMAAARELMQKLQSAQAAVGDAEGDVDLLLATAWLEAAAKKLTSDEAKDAAAKAQEALTQYLALKPQLAELQQKVDQQLTTLQDSFRKMTADLVRQRRGGARDDAGRRRREGRRRPAPEGAAPKRERF